MATFEFLLKAGWKVELKDNPTFHLPQAITDRYSELPRDLTDFLAAINTCANPDNTAWFLTQEHYQEKSDDAFRWNEFELMEIESAKQDNDSDWEKQIRAFWNDHFPFLLSVKTGYSFFAVSLHQENYGSIVHGQSVVEGISESATSFRAFLDSLSAYMKGEDSAIDFGADI